MSKENTVEAIPDEFSLNNAYPNPFNLTTIISYGIPVTSKVRLDVFNTLGQLVNTLVNEQKEPGYHNAIFNSYGLASGIYIYKLLAGDPSAGSGQSFVETKKVILMK